ncbi:FAD-binding oxidoreductase [Pseudoduganella sp. UC29_106]|uniref:FAD-binding oxidoreductase n=1 Tax=Pseudoduganella sp. UC29_106 TaxID=3374553 RepID=UPI00375804D0
MTPLLRKLHKWVGLAIGLQFLLWLSSGLVMSLFDHHVVAGESHRAPAPLPARWPSQSVVAPADILAAVRKPVESIDSHWLAQRPAYRLKNAEGTWLVDAANGQTLPVSADSALQVARADYKGEGKPSTPVLLREPTLEIRKHTGQAWRIDFDDADSTTIYVSAEDGRVLERRNSSWRLFDIAWMLHIMDYTGREDFNNSLVVMMALGGLWMALTGVWLLCTSLRLHDFVPGRLLPARHITVRDEAGKRLGIVKTYLGDSVFNALARNGIQLPSNCGGGQSCGLCEVRACHQPPAASSSDADHIPDLRLSRGHRLACGMVVEGDMEIAVNHGAALIVSRAGVVERVTAVTPFLREIVLRPDQKAGADFRAGSYVQLHIPRYKFDLDGIHRPDEHHEDWKRLPLPKVISSRLALRRSYSLSMPPAQAGGCISLLVRFMPGGKGSSYVYSLKPGDRVTFNGPFGEFALRRGRNEKVFIGGGAGMAPLRAMIHSLLDSGATEPIHFWYGTRSLRELPYREEFDALAARHANFSWHVVLSEGPSDEASPLRGMVHQVVLDEFLRTHPRATDCDFYVCGPPAMLHATRDMLKELGARRVAFDDFKV